MKHIRSRMEARRARADDAAMAMIVIPAAILAAVFFLYGG